jgi:molybdopterin synthase sulfur carrier subunit
MSIRVLIPTPLRNLTSGHDTVEANGSTVAAIFEALEAKHPGLKERLCDGNGEIRRFVNVYVNQEDIRFKDGKNTALRDGDELSIVPAIAGGSAV